MRRSTKALGLVLLLAIPCLAQDGEEPQSKLDRLLQKLRDRDHEKHPEACLGIQSLVARHAGLKVALGPVLACMEHPDLHCQQAAFRVLENELERDRSRLGTDEEKAVRALARVACGQRNDPAQHALSWLGRLTGIDRSRDLWAEWLEGQGEKVEPIELVACVTSGAVNGVDVPDVEARVAELRRIAQRAGAVFERREGGPFFPPVERLYRPISLDERAAAAKALEDEFAARDAAKRFVAAEEAILDLDALVLRTGRNPDPAFAALAKELVARAAKLRQIAAKHELAADVEVTGICVDPERKNLAIIGFGSRSTRIYEEGDELRDKDDRAIPGFKVVKIIEGGVRLSFDGEEILRELKSPQ